MTGKKIQVAVGVDVDSCAGWLGSYGGGDSPNDMRRGVFGVREATWRRGGR
ncbi:hypothetical protein [Nocardia sp. X0981]